jgi:hypothetical protein
MSALRSVLGCKPDIRRVIFLHHQCDSLSDNSYEISDRIIFRERG